MNNTPQTAIHTLPLAADARLSPTDYNDDQIWELSPGVADSPALKLQTNYGGRTGLASILPLWTHDGRMIYQTQAYARPPVITVFAPGYARVEAALTPDLTLEAVYWTMESHAIGGRFTLRNTGKKAADVRLELFGHVGAQGKERPLKLIPLGTSFSALGLGKIGNLNPAIVLEKGLGEGDTTLGVSPKLYRDFTLAAGESVTARWVHAGRLTVRDSLGLAQQWFKADWDEHFRQIEQASAAIPVIQTGDTDTDLALTLAYHQLIRSFLKPTASLPFASLVATRRPVDGFGGAHSRGWDGQPPTLAYPAALGLAAIAPELAQGIIRNYTAIQQPDGWIEWKPGLGGQRSGMLCLPLLARLAWGVFQYTEDSRFLADVFPALLKYFERWFAPDRDADGDGLPEWEREEQTGYPFMPAFAAWQTWGQGADIRYTESPDLIAYLLSEAKSLREIAYYLRQDAEEGRLQERVSALETALESLWREDAGCYSYRDRDTHDTLNGVSIISDARAGDDLLPAEILNPPNRVIVTIKGGLQHVPRLTLTLEGLNGDGQPVKELAEQLTWSHGRGVYTSQTVFAQLDRVKVDGLSRTYRISVDTVDTTGLDMTALLPLWAAGISPEQAEQVIALLTDPARFWRPGGVSMCPGDDPRFDPTNANGGGGVWPFWVTLVGEGLIEYGRLDLAAELVQKVLGAQVTVLKRQKAFYEFYNSDEPQGLGEIGHLGGIPPLHLFLRVAGVRIVSGNKVWTGGAYPLDSPVTIRQHGVTVRRTQEETTVHFASGHTVQLKNGDWQEVLDTSSGNPE
ncbi:MAG: hypothetical protein H6672_18420 [Anaerolineaceae bacterium]|nr:hypothetical protein [Anaerolineaceae bacterium]